MKSLSRIAIYAILSFALASCRGSDESGSGSDESASSRDESKKDKKGEASSEESSTGSPDESTRRQTDDKRDEKGFDESDHKLPKDEMSSHSSQVGAKRPDEPVEAPDTHPTAGPPYIHSTPPGDLDLQAFPELPAAVVQLGLDLSSSVEALDEELGKHEIRPDPKRANVIWNEWRSVEFRGCKNASVTLITSEGAPIFFALELPGCKELTDKFVQALGHPGMVRPNILTWLFRDHLINLKLDRSSIRCELISDSLRQRMNADSQLASFWRDMAKSPRTMDEYYKLAGK